MDLLLIESGNDVVTHHPRFGCRGILHGRDHLEQTVLHRNLKTKAAELAACLNLHVAEVLWIEIRRMWIERRQHTVDGVFNQLGVVRLFDIVRAHMLKHTHRKEPPDDRIPSQPPEADGLRAKLTIVEPVATRPNTRSAHRAELNFRRILEAFPERLI